MDFKEELTNVDIIQWHEKEGGILFSSQRKVKFNTEVSSCILPSYHNIGKSDRKAHKILSYFCHSIQAAAHTKLANENGPIFSYTIYQPSLPIFHA